MSLKTKTQNSHDHQNQSELVGFGSYLCFLAKMLVERDFDLIGMKVDLVTKEKNDAGLVENLSESGGSSDAHALTRFHVHQSHQPPRLREWHRTIFIFIFIIIVVVAVAIAIVVATALNFDFIQKGMGISSLENWRNRARGREKERGVFDFGFDFGFPAVGKFVLVLTLVWFC